MGILTIGVREMVMFLYQSGDLESASGRRRMQLLGQRMHQIHQQNYGNTDESEVAIATQFSTDNRTVRLSGRIDGVLHRGKTVVVEEIKSTQTSLELIDETTFPAHLMQAKTYAAMIAKQRSLEEVEVWLTYIHVETHAIKTVKKRHTNRALLDHIELMLRRYFDWFDVYNTHLENKMKTLKGLAFPYDTMREGQAHLVGAVRRTMIEGETLYAVAPTGVGKTAATLHAALTTLAHPDDKVFYLTAKNAGKTIAVETMERFKQRGLTIKAITLNSKENMCLMDEVDCDPALCPYAKGFYDRVRGALHDLFVHDDVYDATLLKQYGEFHRICPHEFALNVAELSDVVIADYNYVFDPRVRLIRFFEEGSVRPKLLVDEAHNLVERSRQMYSATLSMNDVEAFQAIVSTLGSREKACVNDVLDAMRSAVMTRCNRSFYVAERVDGDLLGSLENACEILGSWLDSHKQHALRKAVRETYFEWLAFLRVHEHVDEAFRFAIEHTDHETTLSIVCLDASGPVSQTFRESAGNVLFSATLKPVDYFRRLLTKGIGETFTVPSPFDPDRLGMWVDVSTSVKYRDRPCSVPRIVDSIYALLEGRRGNYIVFFPSYAFMRTVLAAFDGEPYDVLVETPGAILTEKQRLTRAFLAPSPRSKVLFSVLGGSYAEGVDFPGEALVGVFVIGVGLPQVNPKQALLREYFNAQGLDGFHYAYTFPGMNKVVQAVGRVIRSSDDLGVALLMDTRYDTDVYRDLFPDHWRFDYLFENDYPYERLQAFWKQRTT